MTIALENMNAVQKAAFAGAVVDAGGDWIARVSRPPIIAALGHSMVYRNDYGVATDKRSEGQMVWAEALSGRFVWGPQYNFGIPAETSTQILARVPQVVASGAKACYVLCVINDLGGMGTGSFTPNVPADVTDQNLLAICEQLTRAGIIVLLGVTLPASTHGGSSLTTNMHRRIQRHNSYSRKLARTIPGVLLVDANQNILDYPANNGQALGGGGGDPTDYLADGLHEASRAAFFEGKAIADVIADLGWPKLRRYQESPADIFNDPHNLTGSLMGNAIPSGTAGGTLETGASGTVPSGWRLRRSGSASAVTPGTVVGSIVPRTLENGATINEFQMVCTADNTRTAGNVPAQQDFQFYQNVSVTPGQTFEAACEISVSGITADSLVGVGLIIRYGAGQSVAGLRPQTPFLYPNVPFSIEPTTPSGWVVPDGITTVGVYVDVNLAGGVVGGGATVKVGRPRGGRTI